MCSLHRCLHICAFPVQCVWHGSQRLCEFWGKLSIVRMLLHRVHGYIPNKVEKLSFISLVDSLWVWWGFERCKTSTTTSNLSFALEYYVTCNHVNSSSSTWDVINTLLIFMKGINLLIRTEPLSSCQTGASVRSKAGEFPEARHRLLVGLIYSVGALHHFRLIKSRLMQKRWRLESAELLVNVVTFLSVFV